MTDWLPRELPDRVEIDGLTFIPLTPALVDADYAAVMRDIPMLREWSGQDWPTETFQIDENLDDLIRHDREQTERVALTYSVLIDGTVQGCIYVRPMLAALRTRNLDAGGLAVDAGDIAVRGWLHDRPAVDLIGASMSWLGSEPFAFPRLWWQTNSHCPEQLAACDALALHQVLSAEGDGRTWEMRA